jgi:protein-disulfide isomerase
VPITRRGALALGAGALAGCLGSAGGSTGGTTQRQGGSDGGETTAAGETLSTHPGAAGLDVQPVLGDVSSAPATIVAFEDPSCPTCAAFERGAGARIREEAVPAGDVAFVGRVYPVVYPWGKPASQALESTYARDDTAFWALFDHYFTDQRSFTTENTLERTRAFLADETDVDADAVVADAEAGAHDDAVQADLQAGRDADVRSTPTLLLFRDGAYLTRASGNVSYELLASTLGL